MPSDIDKSYRPDERAIDPRNGDDRLDIRHRVLVFDLHNQQAVGIGVFHVGIEVLAIALRASQPERRANPAGGSLVI